MYWQEESDNDQFVVPDNVLDLSFRIECKALPVDHAWALSEEIQRILPWFAEERLCGLHLIYGADSVRIAYIIRSYTTPKKIAHPLPPLP